MARSPLVSLFVFLGTAVSAEARTWESGASATYTNVTGTSTACGLPPEVNGASASPSLYKASLACGACFAVVCDTERTWNCRRGSPEVIVTILNSCPPPLCDKVQKTLTLSRQVFLQLSSNLPAGVIPVKISRASCARQGGVVFTIDKKSTSYYLAVVISNVGGQGNIKAAYARVGSVARWWPMRHVYGTKWALDGVPVKGRAVSINVVTGDRNATRTFQNVIPDDWNVGQKLVSSTNF